MRFGRMMLVAAGMMLASAPINAQAVAADRSVAPATNVNEMGGGERAIAPLFAILAFVVFLLAASGGDDEPSSP